MIGKRKITATFEIVTPMFLGDANHQASRIRESSIKGVLAFWWRALNYGRFVEEANDDLKAGLAAMQQRERELFGGKECGQGAFLLKVIKQPVYPPYETLSILKESPNEVVGLGARYLAGQGLMESYDGKNTKAGKLLRSCFKENDSFSIRIIFQNRHQNKIEQEIVPALKVFGLLGGLGSRTRRGWGSVSLTDMEAECIDTHWKKIDSRGDYIERLKEIVKSSTRENTGDEFPLTAFAKNSKFFVGTRTVKSSKEMLHLIGAGLQRYRGWRGVGEKNFLADHDWFKAEEERPTDGSFTDSSGRTTAANKLPLRASFGIPHNYFSHNGASNGKNLKMDIEGPSNDKDRRSSPLMVHVHKLPRGEVFGVQSFLPVKFLDPEKISVNGTTKTFEFDSSVISNYLLGFKPDGKTKASPVYFPSDRLL